MTSSRPRPRPRPRRRLRRSAAVAVLAAALAAANGRAQRTPAAPRFEPDLPYVEASRTPRRQCLDLWLPARAGADADADADADAARPPLVVFVHGGTWMAGSKERHAFLGRAFARRGVACAVVNYRLFPFAKWPAFAEDVAAAFAWLRAHADDHGFDPDRMFLMGHSAGGQIAATIAYEPRWLAAHGVGRDAVAGFIGLSGVYDVRPDHPLLRQIFGPTPGDRAGASAIVSVDAAAPPTLLFWADHDLDKLDVSGRMLAARLRLAGADVTAFELAGQNHVGYLFRFGEGAGRDVIGAHVLDFVSGRRVADPAAARAAPVDERRDLPYATGDAADPARTVDLWLPTGRDRPAPLLILVHDGDWTGGDKRDLEPLARACAGLGIAVAAPNYRLAPAHRHPAAVTDVALCCKWLHAGAGGLGCDARRIYLAGIGAGGQLALLAALDPHWLDLVEAPPRLLHAVAALSPICDVRPPHATFVQVFGADPAQRALASPITLPDRRRPPTLLLWGERDSDYLRSINRNMAVTLEARGQRQVSLELPGRAGREMIGDPAGLHELAALLVGFVGP